MTTVKMGTYMKPQGSTSKHEQWVSLSDGLWVILVPVEKLIFLRIDLTFVKTKCWPGAQHFGRPRRADHEVRSLRPAWPTVKPHLY